MKKFLLAVMMLVGVLSVSAQPSAHHPERAVGLEFQDKIQPKIAELNQSMQDNGNNCFMSAGYNQNDNSLDINIMFMEQGKVASLTENDYKNINNAVIETIMQSEPKALEKFLNSMNSTNGSIKVLITDISGTSKETVTKTTDLPK